MQCCLLCMVVSDGELPTVKREGIKEWNLVGQGQDHMATGSEKRVPLPWDSQLAMRTFLYLHVRLGILHLGFGKRLLVRLMKNLELPAHLQVMFRFWRIPSAIRSDCSLFPFSTFFSWVRSYDAGICFDACESWDDSVMGRYHCAYDWSKIVSMRLSQPLIRGT